MEQIVLICAIFFLAGSVQGLTGFGSGLVAIPLLCFVVDVQFAVPLTILNGLIITVFLGFRLRSYLDWRKILPLLAGALPGVVAGVLVLKHLNPEYIKLGLGLILIGYSSYNLLVQPKPINPPQFWAYISGFLTGLITAAISAGGPPSIIYVTLNDWKKEVIKATLSGFFAITASFTLLIQSVAGVVTAELLWVFVWTGPFVLLGTILGSMITDRINRQLYLRAVHMLLTAMGLMLVLG